MKNQSFIIFFLLISCPIFGQSITAWVSFWNKDSSLVGFKDENGKIKIKPKFSQFTTAKYFENIIAVFEEKNKVFLSYYLTKKGSVIGKDSVYIFDNTPDCENEGFIRFRDNKTSKVGLFNKDGNIAAPAIYNDLSRVYNGMVMGWTGAKKVQDKISEINQFGWVGGRGVLIDTSNHILIDSFAFTDDLNFYSLIISAKPNLDTTRINFRIKNKQYYSFINFRKEFEAWLKISILNHLSKETLLQNSFKEISFWKADSGWVNESKNKFLDDNFELIKPKLLQLNSLQCDYDIFRDDGFSFMLDADIYKDFYNDCEEYKSWMYPMMDVVISYKNKTGILQDHFEFVRTKDGYKLLNVTLRSDKLQ